MPSVEDDEFHCSPGEWNLAVFPRLPAENSLTVTVKDGGRSLAVWQESEFYGYEVDLEDHEGKMIHLDALPSEPKRSDIDHITLDGNVPLLVANNLYYVKYLFQEIAALISKTGSVTLFLCDRMPHANQFLELLQDYLIAPLFSSKTYSVETPKNRNEIILQSMDLQLRIDCCSWEKLSGEYFKHDKMDLIATDRTTRYIWNDILRDCLRLPKLSGVHILNSSLKPRGLQAVCSAANLQELKLDYRGAFNMKLLLKGLGWDPASGTKKRKRRGTGGAMLSHLKVLHLEKVKISLQDLWDLLKALEENLTVKNLKIDTSIVFVFTTGTRTGMKLFPSWGPLLQLLRHNQTLESVKFRVRQFPLELRPYSRFTSSRPNLCWYSEHLKQQLQDILLQNRTLGTLVLPVDQDHPQPIKELLELNHFGLRKFTGDQGPFQREEFQDALEFAVLVETFGEDLRLVETLYCLFQCNLNLLEVFW